MSDSALKAEQRGTWEAAAPGWAKWEQKFSAGLLEATDILLDMAGIKPGMCVLDLACGAGSQTLRAASRVGPTGFVVATDISAKMLDYVREHARRGAFDNIRTVECAAEDLEPAQGPYDAAISRLGLMLFSSPSRVLEAVQRVLRPKDPLISFKKVQFQSVAPQARKKCVVRGTARRKCNPLFAEDLE
jgi:ubiquinone/menaquinone biosynthesis C-methylase UbiE